MVGHFEPDPALCHRYARFAAGLERWEFKIMYWAMFGTNLIVLFLVSWVYTKYVHRRRRPPRMLTRRRAQRVAGSGALFSRFQEAHDGAADIHPPLRRVRVRVERHRRHRGLCAAGASVLRRRRSHVAVLVDLDHVPDLVVDRHDGNHPRTAALVVGQQTPVRTTRRGPRPRPDADARRDSPWALALGTPVLVIASLLHLFHQCTKTMIKKLRRKTSSISASGPSMSKA